MHRNTRRHAGTHAGTHTHTHTYISYKTVNCFERTV